METKDVHAIKYKMSKAKERCMAYFRLFHSYLQVLSKKELKGTRTEHGSKRAFMSLFGQDNDTFKSTMLLNVDQLQKKLDKDEFQEDGSMAAFWAINRQFQQFIDSQFTLDYDSQMTDMYFAAYTGIEYDRRVNKRQMQTQESKIDMGNDTDADDADIRPIYNEEPMAEVQLTAECDIFAIGKQHTEQPEIINEGRVNQYHEQRQVKSPMLDSSPDNQTTDYSKQSLECIIQCKAGKSQSMVAEKEDISETIAKWCLQRRLHQMTVDHNNQASNLNVQMTFEQNVQRLSPQFALKSSAVTTADASDKRQQQPDSTSSTSSLATSVTADGNFD
ncbi:hypothetical protein Tco_0089799 [Tanacetum coccineum]